MISVSSAYKTAMSKRIRDRAYVTVGIGVVNQDAQNDAQLDYNESYWDKGNLFDTSERYTYATLEEDLLKADGSLRFVPEDSTSSSYLDTGITTSDFLGKVKIVFSKTYSIKGLTIDFSDAYPTNFSVKTAQKTLEFENDSNTFSTSEVLGDVNYIEIIPNKMIGGQQRFRIKSILLGVGLSFGNKQTKEVTLTEYVSGISQDLPNQTLNYSFFDENDNFSIENEGSFLDFLETMQKVTLSFGVTLSDGSIEWKQVGTLFLKEWKNKNKIVSIVATDRLEQMEDEYTLSNRIYTRTAYEEAVSIFTDAGLEQDEYLVDDYLKDITLTNPMPEGTHKECLQILANACRCILRQTENGIVEITANFAIAFNPEDITITTNGVSDWSTPDNVMIGSDFVYADLTQDFFKLDGSMYFLPEDGSYLKTSYVSKSISNSNGNFSTNPKLKIAMSAAYTYYSVNVNFEGNPPKEMKVVTYKNSSKKETTTFTDLSNRNFIAHEFADFDAIEFEFTKAYPNNRIVVRNISFSDPSDFVLDKNNMTAEPAGYKEKRVKEVKCKVFTYTQNEEGEIEEVEDNVYASSKINDVGEVKYVKNPLISTQKQAEALAGWVSDYFKNNVTYDVDYRGDPRNNAADIIHMNSSNNEHQVEIVKHTLKYNGAFSGSMELKRR